MPIYIGDYLAATSRLTTQQHGAYLLLMMDYWKSGPPPDNPEVLAQITRMTIDARSIAQASIKHYFNVVDGYWRHGRIDEELAKADKNRETAQSRAAAGAAARWRDKKNAPSNAPSNAQAMLDSCSSPSPSPLNKKNKNIAPKNSKYSPLDDLKNRGIDEKVAKDWLAVRKVKKLAPTETAFDIIFNEIKKTSLLPNDVLKTCCANGWAGFKASWLDKENKNGNSPDWFMQ